MSNERQEAIEAVARYLFISGANMPESKAEKLWDGTKPNKLGDDWRNAERYHAEHILDLTKPDGTKRLGIIADD